MSRARRKAGPLAPARSRRERERHARAAPEKPEQHGGEQFLQRWSRRKAQARSRASAVAPVPSAKPVKPLTDADMPPIDTLGEKSDFSVFLSPGVSEALRKRALRRMFALPGIGERDALDGEYYDCRGFEPLGNVITHDMREAMAREARKLQEMTKSPAPEKDKKPEPAPADETVAVTATRKPGKKRSPA